MMLHASTGPARIVRICLVGALAAGGSFVGGSSVATAVDAPATVIDDFEDGDVSDWVFFGGNAAGGGGGLLGDRPYEGAGYFSTGWGGEGTASGFYGGTFTNLDDAAQVVLPPDPWFNAWVLNQSDSTVDGYQLEVTIREDLAGDGWTDGADDSFRLDTVFTSADFDDEWRLVSAPVSTFADQFTGGDGTFDGDLDEIVLVVAGVTGGSGSVLQLDLDQLAFSSGGPITARRPIDDFESGLPFGSATPSGEPLGFYTFQGDGSVSISTAASPPAPAVPDAAPDNEVLQIDVDVASFAGYIHAFENATVDTWVTQDWSTSEGIAFWMHGTSSGTQMFIDILDNRNPASTTDDAERFTVAFTDDFDGWQLLEFPFTSFTRKEIGNGAPNDGLGLFEMHGYALGTLGTGGPRTFYVDDVALYGVAEPPALAVNLSRQNTLVDEGATAAVAVKLNRPMGPDDPEQVSIAYTTERSNAIAGEEYSPTSGTLVFVNGGPTELTFPVETFDDTKFEGDEQIVVRLTDPVDVDRGALFQGSVLIDDDDPFDPLLLDDFEQGAYLWESTGSASIEAVRSEADDPAARPGQDAVEQFGVATVPIAVDIEVSGPTCRSGTDKGNDKTSGVVAVRLLGTATLDATTIDVSTVRYGDATETHVDRDGASRRHLGDVDGDGLDDLVLHFRADEIGVACGEVASLTGSTIDGREITTGGSDASLEHDFALGPDWTGTERLSFWYQGGGGGEEVTLTLQDNRAPDPGPDGWQLAWSDEFDTAAGARPDPANWAYELGDTTPDGKNGWGNEELQYYTDDADNAATDGDGNLVITLDEADGDQECYYGPCAFESARLVTQHRAEFAYGRIESRLKVPSGGDGLWPAFWSLGTDITYNPWPGAGEIDVMEYVSRLPDEIFGTIHGPGYNGGNSFSGIYDDFGEPVAADYHTFAVEWQPDLIIWYVDGIEYHRAVPADVPGPWVFDKPFFLLLNFAIGGNFGGAIDPDNVYPQEYLVDYVRVYQAPDTAERFEASFTDDVAGWREISIPIDDFVRSAEQPVGAPDDGLGLDEVWGYGFEFPEGTATGTAGIDLVRRVPVPPPTDLVVTNLADSGPGSLRAALGAIAGGGTITFDPAIAGGTIELDGAQLSIDRSVTIDASSAAPIVISAGGRSRVVEVGAGVSVSMNDLVIRDGVAAPQGGGILNAGALTLDRVVVTDNLENSTATNFAFGGGGIYNGDGATLTMTDSTVSDNATVAQPGGGLYGSFDSTITITRTTVSGNVGGDVAGGLRSLGDTTVVNSTFSGNTSTAWHGGAMFLTDGNVTISNTTIVGNRAPAGTAGGLMVATFGAPVDVTIADNVIADNGAYSCQREGSAAAVLTSLGGNVVTDASCSPVATDVLIAPGAAGLGPLANNGGPTSTHALVSGSPAVDAAIGPCPATDQRGAARPQGAVCDAGAFELLS
jgi:beta-glucanase (GH16 family)